MATSTKKDRRRELLVAGYVRDIERAHKIHRIPAEINDIIYLYQRLYDEWSKQYSSKKVTIDEIGSMITMHCDQDVTAFGCHVVTKGIFKWRIKMVKFTYDEKIDGSPPYVGIIEDNEEYMEEYKNSCDWDENGYLLCCKIGRLLCGDILTSDYPCRWNKEGDILEMTLDLNERTLSFKVNDEDYGVAFEDIEEREYRLAFGGYKCDGSQFMLL